MRLPRPPPYPLFAVLAMLAYTAALVAVCFMLGQGVLALCGYAEWRWWAPALGYGVLLIWFGQVVRIPNHGGAQVVIALVAALATLALPLVRRAIREAFFDGAVVGVGIILLAAVPFFAAGHTGVLGANVSNDMSTHLLGAYWLRTEASTLPLAAIGGDIITTGYPIGPHALAAAIVRASWFGEERAFSVVMLAVPVLTAFAVLGVVPAARRGARWALAAIVGLGYLPAAYLVQGSFKETIEAMLVVAAAVAMSDLAREQWPEFRWRSAPRALLRGAPIGLLAGATVYEYSYGGAFWIIGTAGMFVVIELARRRRSLLAIARRGVLPVAGAAIAAAIVVAPEVSRIQAFSKSIFGVEPLTNKGNLVEALNPLETIGVWFSGDFRFYPTPEWPSVVFCVVGLAVLLGGLWWWWRERAIGVPAAIVASIVIWAELALTRNIYNAAKGLIVLAPLVMLAIGAPLAAAWSARRRTARGRAGVTALRVVGVVLLAAAAVSTAGVLRSANVGLGSHEQELASFRPIVRGHSVLFVENDHFAQWELRGVSQLYTTNALYAPAHIGMHQIKWGGLPFDVDNYPSRQLDKADFIVATGGPYRSEIPPNFKLVRRTASYELFRREGRTPTRVPLEPPGDPGAVVDCTLPGMRSYIAHYGWAGVLPQPVVASDWQGSIAKPGETARLRVTLPRGRWDISLQYISTTGLTVRGPGLAGKRLAPNFGQVTQFWPAGTVTGDGKPITLTVTDRQRSWFGQLIGSPRGSIGPLAPNASPIWNAAFTRHGETPKRVPSAQACGRYVDWFAPAGSAMSGRSDGA